MNNTDPRPPLATRTITTANGDRFEMVKREMPKFTLEGVKTPDRSRNAQRGTPAKRTRRFYI